MTPDEKVAVRQNNFFNDEAIYLPSVKKLLNKQLWVDLIWSLSLCIHMHSTDLLMATNLKGFYQWHNANITINFE